MRCKKRGDRGKGRRGFKVSSTAGGYGEGRNVRHVGKWEPIEPAVAELPITAADVQQADSKQERRDESAIQAALRKALKGA